jgi:Holliday junction resolvase RusA-like endonuclease
MSLEKDKPSIYGDLEFFLPLTPVSQQANSAAKRTVTESIQTITRSLEYILTGDVQIEFEWFIHEQLRYESDEAPDVDNIIKPLLDGLCGSDGILIDDCQVQSITCYWVDWMRNEQLLGVRINHLPDDWLRKKNLIFIQFSKGLCFPVNHCSSKALLLEKLDSIEAMIKSKEETQSETGDYYHSKIMLPCQRFFHRTRIHGFPVFKVDELRRQASDS